MRCARCKFEILEKDYCSVSDYHNRKRKKEIFLHLKCWKNMYTEGIQKALREKVGQVMRMVKQ